MVGRVRAGGPRSFLLALILSLHCSSSAVATQSMIKLNCIALNYITFLAGSIKHLLPECQRMPGTSVFLCFVPWLSTCCSSSAPSATRSAFIQSLIFLKAILKFLVSNSYIPTLFRPYDCHRPLLHDAHPVLPNRRLHIIDLLLT